MAWDSHDVTLCPQSQEERGALGCLELYCREAVPERMRGIALAPMLVLGVLGMLGLRASYEL